jgi:transcriptional regulator with XRE-family HTH domain
MPQQNTHSRRRGFGVYLGHLRDSRNENQEAFATQLNVSRSLLASVENGERKPSAIMLAQLDILFPDRKHEIAEEVEKYSEASLTEEERAWATTRRKIEGLIAANALLEAANAVIEAIIDQPVGATSEELWLWLRKGEIETMLGAFTASVETYGNAWETARSLDRPRSAVVTIWDQWICAELCAYGAGAALRAVNKALHEFPRDICLSYRKAAIQWGIGDLAGALVSLTVVLKRDSALLTDALCLRGLIRAESGHLPRREAFEDLDQALSDSDNPPIEHACAASVRLWVAFTTERISYMEAMAAFNALEQASPRNAWIFYYRGRCRIDNHATRGDGYNEWTHFALMFDEPALCRWQIEQLKYDLDAAPE